MTTSNIMCTNDIKPALIYRVILCGLDFRAQNLRQGIAVKTSFRTRVLRMRLGSFVDINIYFMKYYFI